MYEILQNVMEFVGEFGEKIKATVAFISAIASVCAWIQVRNTGKVLAAAERLRKQPITIILSYGCQRVKLPYLPRRDQLSRAELLGILGLYGGKERFDTSRLIPIFETGHFNAILAGEENAIEIPCDEKFFIAVDTDVRCRQTEDRGIGGPIPTL